MKTLFIALSAVIKVIVALVFASGVALTTLGMYDFAHAFSYLFVEHDSTNFTVLMAVGLLKAVDLFLVAIVLFVFSIGILILFETRTDSPPAVLLPEWLKIKNFIQLKVILWEAILTTLVVSYLAGLAAHSLNGTALSLTSLIIPAAILLIALSVYFLKKGEH